MFKNKVVTMAGVWTAEEMYRNGECYSIQSFKEFTATKRVENWGKSQKHRNQLEEA